MRPPLVTESEVLEAARRVRARGKEINGWSIRRELGDRGNPRRLLTVWTAKGDAAPPAAEPVDTVSLPAPLLELVAAAQTALTTELDTIVCTIHRHAREDADATFRRITDDLQASEQRIKEQLDLAEASVDATETEMDRRGDAIVIGPH
ncbi:DNA-binding protein [Belnapia rosea]|uniref:Replication region DNA-binding N-term n=1 Tax=Belnapia rosea TaxID=938405 RepID=A0A1G7AQN0_9PROT|nr:DNA-binding protein [Belnapia rosea]SDB74433.1 replication region DNA-binding N-term [Belnapia rosea]SDE17101.1 replication region DNA-binding N-term [Belnapia rosea]